MFISLQEFNLIQKDLETIINFSTELLNFIIDNEEDEFQLRILSYVEATINSENKRTTNEVDLLFEKSNVLTDSLRD